MRLAWCCVVGFVMLTSDAATWLPAAAALVATPLTPTCLQVLEHCREVYVDRQARSGVEETGPSAAQTAAAAVSAAAQAKGGKGPTAKEAAFRAAVNAARKRGGGAALITPSNSAAL